MIFGVLTLLFSKFLWKIGFMSNEFGTGLLPVPNLNGNWKGTFKRSDGEVKKVKVTITQDWNNLDLVLESDQTISRIIHATMFVVNKDDK